MTKKHAILFVNGVQKVDGIEVIFKVASTFLNGLQSSLLLNAQQTVKIAEDSNQMEEKT
ncbi:MAG: hypothetical protein II994_04280 [Lachnospiraceae bacterium]|nr:hypothetical protein [Lachnospiraceae bacterium]